MQNQVLKKLSDLESLISSQTKKEIIPFQEAWKYLNISSSYLYKLTHRRQISFYKPNGKKIYFLKEDLNNWLLRNRTASVEEIEKKAIEYVTSNGEKK